MEFKADLHQLNEALSLASVVKPKAIDSAGNAGFLFVARGDTCFIYSEDESQKSRVSFPIADLDEEGGSFVFPMRAVGPLSCLEGDVLLKAFEEEGTHVVEYEADGDANQKIPTFDPRGLQSLDKDLEAAEDINSFSPVLLKEALSAVRPFMADARDARAKDVFKCLHVFDSSKPEWEKGNGTMFGASGFKAAFFFSPDLKDHGLTLHGLRIALLSRFLSNSDGQVRLKRSASSTYFINSEDQVIGWADSTSTPNKFEYYSLKKEPHVLRIAKEPLLKSLSYVRKALDAKKDRVRVRYDHSGRVLRVLASDSGMEITAPPVAVVPLTPEDGTEGSPVHGGEKSKTEDFACNFNIDFFIELISAVKGHEVELRVMPFPKRQDNYLFRTVEVYLLGSNGKVQIVEPEQGSNEKVYKCQVTRFAPSKN